MTDKNGKILVVDDEMAIRRLIQGKLTHEGYDCEEASNGEQVLERLRSKPFALVLLDVKMPGRSGAEILPEIKANYPDTAVIMATAVTDVTIAINCMRHGAYDYLTKPFNLDELLMSVNRALEKRRLELENRDYQLHLEQKVEDQAGKLRTSFLGAVTALAYALEAKDRYTSGHSQRVSEISVDVARELGIPIEEAEKIRVAGLVHDIGKIGIRESVLNKAGKLTEEEYRQVKSHPATGERILTPIMDTVEILKIVRHHHEHYDGTSYPDGLAGEEIPLGARILALADSYDAMTSERPYRKSMSEDTAVAEIERCRGTQFDPEVAAAFFRAKDIVALIKRETLREG